MTKQIEIGESANHNLYSAVVSYNGNEKAISLMGKVFEVGDAHWRGIGKIENSGLYLKDEYKKFDAGSRAIGEENRKTPCRCGDVLCGRISPKECALFGKVCTPMSPKGPCMVSSEGACGIWY